MNAQKIINGAIGEDSSDTERTMLNAVSLLNDRGVACSYEHPGFIDIPLKDGKTLACGDLNGPFHVNRVDSDGHVHDFDFGTIPDELSAECTDEQLADWLQKVVDLCNQIPSTQ